MPALGLTLKAVPDNFPNKGKFRIYDKGWNVIGWSDEPQYSGQLPLRFPEEWSPFECFLGGSLCVE